MKFSTKLAATSTLAIGAVAAVGLTVASAASGDESDTPISGDALQPASDAALAYTGGGRVTGTEVDDEESKYEVEVTLDNGNQVDVQLDEQFKVVSSKNDGTGDST